MTFFTNRGKNKDENEEIWKSEFNFWVLHSSKIRFYRTFSKNLRKKIFFEILTWEGHARIEVSKGLKAESCKLYNEKFMIASTQKRNTEIFAIIIVLIFKLLSRKVLFINRTDNKNCQKVGWFLRKYQVSRANYCKIISIWKAKFSGYFWNT